MNICFEHLMQMIKEFFIPCEGNKCRPRALENDMFFVILILIVGIKFLGGISFSNYLGADIFNAISKVDLYQLINEERTANAVSPLKVNPKLEIAASLKLEDMFKNDYFGHNSPAGLAPWHWFDDARYSYNFAGENLAMNFTSSNSAVKAWMASDGHRKNILLKDFKETGIAVGQGVINGRETVVVVQLFGSLFSAEKASAAVKQQPKTGVVEAGVKDSDLISYRKNLAAIPKAIPKVVKKEAVSLKQVAGSVDSSVSQNIIKKPKNLGENYYVLENFFKLLNFYIIIAAAIILMLKIFVAIKVQYPALIIKGVLLIAIAVAAFLIENNSFAVYELVIK